MSIFNPWVILGFIIAVTSSFFSGYHKGSTDEFDKQQLEIARLNNEARQKEQALVAAVNTQTTQLVKANNDAKIQIAKRNAAIDTGTFKLRIPVKTTCPSIPTSPDTAVASRDSVQTTAEPEPTFVRAALAITDQGDANTRQLNACIDAYNTVYQTLKGTSK